MIIPRPKESFCSSKLEYRVLLPFKWILFFTIALPCCISCSKVFVGEETPLLADFEAIEKGERVIFLNKSSSNATYYQLKIPNGSDVYYGNIKDTLATYTFSSNGLYDVKLQVKDKNGRQAEISKKIKVTQLKLGPVPVDSTLLVKPEFKISYQILDSGWVQFYNYSKGLKTSNWNTLWGLNWFENSPKYWFPNGSQYVRFGGIYPDPEFPNDYPDIFKIMDTTIVFNITNSAPQIDSKRFMKGVVFGDSVDVTYDLDIQNHFLGGGIPSYDSLTPVSYIWPDYKIDYFSLADLNTVRGTTIENMRKQFKVGPIDLAQFQSITGKLVRPGWQVFLYGKFESGGRTTISGKYNQPESLEILSVKEIYQPPVFPGLDPTAFIVTFRFKATTYGTILGEWPNDLPHIEGKDKIDLTFDVKFNIYPKGVF